MITAKNVFEFSQRLHVLYVEDDANLRQETQMLLEPFFEHLDIANDGLEGLEKFSDHFYDIIVTDINMPRMNGIEMIDKIREINPEQKIIAISAHNEGEILVNLIRAGVTGFILKPIIQQEVINVLYPVCRDAYAQRITVQLFEELNEERDELKKRIESLEAQLKSAPAAVQAVETATSPAPSSPPAPAEASVEQPLIDDYFSADDDEGEENVLFLKDDCDEMLEMFNEMPELMLQYTNTQDTENIHTVVNYLKKISSILLHYTPFLDPLAKSFDELAATIENNMDDFIAMFTGNSEAALTVWDAISIDMERYMTRFTVESMAMKNIHHIHQPTTLSIRQIIDMICPPEADEGDIEFF
jgi:CheY-like chemotaxis protein